MDDWFSDEKATFGDRLVGAREAAGIGQDELAHGLGVGLATIRAWEEDMSEPRANRIQMLAGMLNVSLTWLLTGRGAGGVAPPDQPAAAAGQLGALVADLRMMRAEVGRLADRIGTMEMQMQRVARGEAP